jgi:succinyl-CoA synthetase alpha subunit
MSILINKNTRVITQGITGKTGQFHTEKCQEYANGKECFVAGVNPKKAGEKIFNIPIYASVKEAAAETGATVSVIYVPPAGAAAAIWEAVEADLDLAICITEGIPVRDMSRTGIPSVIQIAKSRSASTASQIAAAAPAGGT